MTPENSLEFLNEQWKSFYSICNYLLLSFNVLKEIICSRVPLIDPSHLISVKKILALPKESPDSVSCLSLDLPFISHNHDCSPSLIYFMNCLSTLELTMFSYSGFPEPVISCNSASFPCISNNLWTSLLNARRSSEKNLILSFLKEDILINRVNPCMKSLILFSLQDDFNTFVPASISKYTLEQFLSFRNKRNFSFDRDELLGPFRLLRPNLKLKPIEFDPKDKNRFILRTSTSANAIFAVFDGIRSVALMKCLVDCLKSSLDKAERLLTGRNTNESKASANSKFANLVNNVKSTSISKDYVDNLSCKFKSEILSFARCADEGLDLLGVDVLDFRRMDPVKSNEVSMVLDLWRLERKDFFIPKSWCILIASLLPEGSLNVNGYETLGSEGNQETNNESEMILGSQFLKACLGLVAVFDVSENDNDSSTDNINHHTLRLSTRLHEFVAQSLNELNSNQLLNSTNKKQFDDPPLINISSKIPPVRTDISAVSPSSSMGFLQSLSRKESSLAQSHARPVSVLSTASSPVSKQFFLSSCSPLHALSKTSNCMIRSGTLPDSLSFECSTATSRSRRVSTGSLSSTALHAANHIPSSKIEKIDFKGKKELILEQPMCLCGSSTTSYIPNHLNLMRTSNNLSNKSHCLQSWVYLAAAVGFYALIPEIPCSLMNPIELPKNLSDIEIEQSINSSSVNDNLSEELCSRSATSKHAAAYHNIHFLNKTSNIFSITTSKNPASISCPAHAHQISSLLPFLALSLPHTLFRRVFCAVLCYYESDSSTSNSSSHSCNPLFPLSSHIFSFTEGKILSQATTSESYSSILPDCIPPSLIDWTITHCSSSVGVLNILSFALNPPKLLDGKISPLMPSTLEKIMHYLLSTITKNNYDPIVKLRSTRILSAVLEVTSKGCESEQSHVLSLLASRVSSQPIRSKNLNSTCLPHILLAMSPTLETTGLLIDRAPVEFLGAVDSDGRSLLHIVCAKQSVFAVRRLLSKMRLHEQLKDLRSFHNEDIKGRSALVYAVNPSIFKGVKSLLFEESATTNVSRSRVPDSLLMSVICPDLFKSSGRQVAHDANTLSFGDIWGFAPGEEEKEIEELNKYNDYDLMHVDKDCSASNSSRTESKFLSTQTFVDTTTSSPRNSSKKAKSRGNELQIENQRANFFDFSLTSASLEISNAIFRMTLKSNETYNNCTDVIMQQHPCNPVHRWASTFIQMSSRGLGEGYGPAPGWIVRQPWHFPENWFSTIGLRQNSLIIDREGSFANIEDFISLKKNENRTYAECIIPDQTIMCNSYSSSFINSCDFEDVTLLAHAIAGGVCVYVRKLLESGANSLLHSSILSTKSTLFGIIHNTANNSQRNNQFKRSPFELAIRNCLAPLKLITDGKIAKKANFQDKTFLDIKDSSKLVVYNDEGFAILGILINFMIKNFDCNELTQIIDTYTFKFDDHVEVPPNNQLLNDNATLYTNENNLQVVDEAKIELFADSLWYSVCCYQQNRLSRFNSSGNSSFYQPTTDGTATSNCIPMTSAQFELPCGYPFSLNNRAISIRRAVGYLTSATNDDQFAVLMAKLLGAARISKSKH